MNDYYTPFYKIVKALFFGILLGISPTVFSQGGSWQVISPDFPASTGRAFAVTIEIQKTIPPYTKDVYFGTGQRGSTPNAGNLLSDFWKYNPTNQTWQQLPDVPGGGRSAAVGFSMGGNVFVGTGILNNTTTGLLYCASDILQYTPTNNTWRINSGLPPGRCFAMAVGGSIGIIGGGKTTTGASLTDVADLDDFYIFNPTKYGIFGGFDYTGTFPFGKRAGSVALNYNGYSALFIGGFNGSGTNLNEVYLYSPREVCNSGATGIGTFTRLADIPTAICEPRRYATGFSKSNFNLLGQFVYYGTGVNATGNKKNDLFLLNRQQINLAAACGTVAGENWKSMANYPYGVYGASAYNISEYGVLGTGIRNGNNITTAARYLFDPQPSFSIPSMQVLSVSGITTCAGGSFTLNLRYDNSFTNGSTFGAYITDNGFGYSSTLIGQVLVVTTSTGNGNINGKITCNIPFGLAGTGYELRIKASSKTEVSASIPLTILAAPKRPDLNIPNPVCSNQPLIMYSSPNMWGGGNSYNLSIPTSYSANVNTQIIPSQGSSPSFAFVTASITGPNGLVGKGIANATVTATNILGCKSEPTLTPFTIVGLAQAPTITGSNTICGLADGSSVYTVVSVAGITYNWSIAPTITGFTGNATLVQSGTNATVTGTKNGRIKLICSAIDICPVPNSVTKTIAIQPIPTPPNSVSGYVLNPNQCLDMVVSTVRASFNGNFSNVWSLNPTSIGGITSGFVTTITNGNTISGVLFTATGWGNGALQVRRARNSNGCTSDYLTFPFSRGAPYALVNGLRYAYLCANTTNTGVFTFTTVAGNSYRIRMQPNQTGFTVAMGTTTLTTSYINATTNVISFTGINPQLSRGIVEIEATDGSVCAHVTTVTMQGMPQIGAIAGLVSFCGTGNFTISGAGSYAGVNYQWSELTGIGTGSTTANTIGGITANLSGIATVRGQAYNTDLRFAQCPGNIVTTTSNIFRAPQPILNFTNTDGTAKSVCLGNPISMRLNTYSGETYTWSYTPTSFTGIITPSANTATATLTGANLGIYTINIVPYHTTCGIGTTHTATYKVDNQKPARPTITGIGGIDPNVPSICKVPYYYNYTGYSTVVQPYTQDNNKTVSGAYFYFNTPPNFFVSFTSQGRATIAVAHTNGCGTSDADVKYVDVMDIPLQPSTIAGTDLLCPNTTAMYSVSSVLGVTSYLWSVAGTAAIIARNYNQVTVSSTGLGTFTLSVAGLSSCNTTVGVVRVQTFDNRIANFSLSGVSNFCRNAGAQRDYNVVNPNPKLSYTWSITGIGARIAYGYAQYCTIENTITGHNPQQISVYAIANNGCTSILSVPKVVDLNDIPFAPSITGTSYACAGIPTSYTVSTIAGLTSTAWVYNGYAVTSTVSGNIVIVKAQIPYPYQDFYSSSTNINAYLTNNCGSGPIRQKYIFDVLGIPLQPTAITAPVLNCSGQKSVLSFSGFVDDRNLYYNLSRTIMWSVTGMSTQISSNTNVSTILSTGVGKTYIIVKATNSCYDGQPQTLEIDNTPQKPTVTGPENIGLGIANKGVYYINSLPGYTNFATVGNGLSGTKVDNYTFEMTGTQVGLTSFVAYADYACGGRAFSDPKAVNVRNNYNYIANYCHTDGLVTYTNDTQTQTFTGTTASISTPQIISFSNSTLTGITAFDYTYVDLAGRTLTLDGVYLWRDAEFIFYNGNISIKPGTIIYAERQCKISMIGGKFEMYGATLTGATCMGETKGRFFSVEFLNTTDVNIDGYGSGNSYRKSVFKDLFFGINSSIQLTFALHTTNTIAGRFSIRNSIVESEHFSAYLDAYQNLGVTLENNQFIHSSFDGFVAGCYISPGINTNGQRLLIRNNYFKNFQNQLMVAESLSRMSFNSINIDCNTFDLGVGYTQMYRKIALEISNGTIGSRTEPSGNTFIGYDDLDENGIAKEKVAVGNSGYDPGGLGAESGNVTYYATDSEYRAIGSPSFSINTGLLSSVCQSTNNQARLSNLEITEDTFNLSLAKEAIQHKTVDSPTESKWIAAIIKTYTAANNLEGLEQYWNQLKNCNRAAYYSIGFALVESYYAMPNTAKVNGILTELILADVANKEVATTAAWLQLRNRIAARFAANYPYLTYTPSDSVALAAIVQVGASVSMQASMLLFKEFGKKLIATQKLPQYNYAHISCSNSESARKGLDENSLIGSLSDAVPNPAADETKIWYVLKDKKLESKIIIRNLVSGRLVKEVQLDTNHDEIVLNLSEYISGVYTYSLIVDGMLVSTKKLVVVR